MSQTNVRFAQFNASLNRNSEGQLVTDLSTPNNAQAKAVAEIIQRTNPDVLLINEFDYVQADPLQPVRLFQENYLSVSQNGADPVSYEYAYIAPSNTGITSGFDLDNNGSVVTTPGAPGYGNDAFGFGNFPGQFGMVLLSKYPIDTANIRTFQNFLWKDMPGALLPDDASTPIPADWYSPAELDVFRLSSKSHWDVPINVDGEIIHALVSHPTPPVFDGPEDRNGRRNHDEIRFWADYVSPGKGGYIYDDKGTTGGLTSGASFVIMGDQNADPQDGDSVANAILQILDNPLVNTSVTPSSFGGFQQAFLQGGANAGHRSNPIFDTADFADSTPGNLRTDYVLPSTDLKIKDAQVFWPLNTDPRFPLVGTFNPAFPGGFPSSDHRLVWADLITNPGLDATRQSVTDVDFLGQTTFATGFEFDGTQVGGLSSISYDRFNRIYYAISDDRSQFNPARFYTLSINLADGRLSDGDVTFQDVTTLLDGSGNPFPALSLDPEGLVLIQDGRLYISSEGDANNLVNPFVNEFSLTGQQVSTLPIPGKYLPTADRSSGIRNNLAFESLTITPDQRYLFTATENALFQDGPAAGLDQESPARILRYDLATGQPDKEILYFTDPVEADSVPPGGFITNGLVELLALDNGNTLLALERSFSAGVGNSIKLYEVNLANTTNLLDVDRVGGLEVDAVAEKRLLLDFADLNLPLDNIEGMTFGPTLPDGRRTLVIVSDNNFNATQFTQFLAFAVDLNSTPAVAPKLETPSLNRITEDGGPDADDPAIYVHPTDSSKSLVITALKDGGLAVYDLNGEEVQRILPPTPIRYNNVDLVYGFRLGGRRVDLAIATDRRNDTLAIWSINPQTGKLTNITASTLSNPAASIFGVDDGSQTAYGLATYTSPVTGKSYVFVSQRDGNQIAQLELVNTGGRVSAKLVRTLTVPIPPDGELEDAQVEGMVVDRELGYLYVGQEQRGIWKFLAEPDAPTTGTLIEVVKPDGQVITADVEGLTIYYGANGTGYLLASSQGDSTYAVFTRDGSNDYLGSFAVDDGIDGVAESDGADVTNVPLGANFPKGLLVVHDGSNDPQEVLEDDGEVQNFNTNFKFVPWEDVAHAFPDPLDIDTSSYNPRQPKAQSLINNVASGDTTQTSTVLWARSTFTGKVKFEYSTQANFRRILGTQTVQVTDPLNPAKVLLEGLKPGTEYFYRVTDAAGATATGRFNTSVETGTRAGLSFGATGDWRGEIAPYPGIANADDFNLDFFIELGDTIYADFPSPALRNPDGTRKAQAETLDEYRIKHAEVYGSRFGLNTWGDLRSSTSILATIDDHEVINDFQGGAPASSDPRFGVTTGLINDTPLYENGIQAFQEYNPIRDEFYGATGEERTAGERKLYRYRTYGSDAAAFIIDARSFRDQGLPAVANLNDPAQVGAFLAASFNPTRTMLGRPQVEDLKTDLLKAEAAGVTWKFITVPEPIQNLGILAASDRFEGYAAERTEILKFIDDNDIDNVVFIAADIHGTLVNNLTYQVGPGQAQIPTTAFEITTGSLGFDAPFGPTVADIAAAIGLLSPEQKAFYDSQSIAGKDAFIKQLTNNGLNALGYDPLGLNANLPVADGLINAKLLQGDYVTTHVYGWTGFDINPQTQKLTVTTYGIPFYSEEQLLANPSLITSLTPSIVSQFEVTPTQLGRGGNFTFKVAAGSGTTTVKDFGGAGHGAQPHPSMKDEVDVLQFEGAGLTARNLLLTQVGDNVEVTFEGVADTKVVLQDLALPKLENFNRHVGNILFDGQATLGNTFDVVNAAFQDSRVLGRNTVTFLNELDNITRGFNNSDDVINGQGGNDELWGWSGDDLLRGGAGNDTLYGGYGDDVLRGGDGDDLLHGGSGSDIVVLAAGDGTDTIADFNLSEGDRIGLAGGLTVAQLSVTQGSGTNANNTLITITGTSELLAVLTGVQSSTVGDSAFTVV